LTEVKVFLREEGRYGKVRITSKDKPEIEPHIIEKWQAVADLVAEALEVPAALIMKSTNTHMEVFVKSASEGNPYPEDGKDELGHGLYCEEVIGKDRPFEMKNASRDEIWKDNPDVSLRMISYYGLPLRWHDGEIFGTICVLDRDPRTHDEQKKRLMMLLRDSLEVDLHNLELIQNLYRMANIDALTGVSSRRRILELLQERSETSDKKPFYLAMVDLVRFKAVNDKEGHKAGDKVLEALGSALKKFIADNGHVGRLGGDEFLALWNMDDQDLEGQKKRLEETIIGEKEIKKHDLEVSIGIAKSEEASGENLLALADKRLLRDKRDQRDK